MVKIDKTTKALADRYYAEQCRKLGTKGMPKPRQEPEPAPSTSSGGPWATPRSWKAELGIGKTATIHVEEDPAKWLEWADTAAARGDLRGFMTPNDNLEAPQVDLQAIWEHFNAL